jgi:hypothetical protein
VDIIGQSAEGEDLVRSVAGLVDSGIGRPLPLPLLWLPPVWLDGEFLCWGLRNWNTRRDTQIRNFDRVLPEFIALADGGKEKILEFARKFGPLVLCAKHDGPLFHVSECDSPEYFEPITLEKDASEQQKEEFFAAIQCVTRLDAWRFWARYVRALSALAIAVRQMVLVTRGIGDLSLTVRSRPLRQIAAFSSRTARITYSGWRSRRQLSHSIWTASCNSLS